MSKKNYKKGMSASDIREKIKVLKTNEGKINYLESIKPKIGITNPSTQKAFYEIMGDLNFDKEDFDSAVKYYKKVELKKKISETYKKMGDTEKNITHKMIYYDKAELEGNESKETWKNLGDEAFEKKDFGAANKCYKKAGVDKSKEVRNKWVKEGNDVIVRGGISFAEDFYKRTGLSNTEIEKKWKEGGDRILKSRPDLAVNCYKKAGLDKSKNVEDLELISEAYEQAGESIKSMDIQRKINHLGKKNLEKKIINSLLGFLVLGGLFFGKGVVNGAVIGGVKSSSGLLGIIFLTLGVFGLFFYNQK